MQLRDFARLTAPVDRYAAGSIGRIVGRRLDQTSFIIEFTPYSRVEVAAWQVEATTDEEVVAPVANMPVIAGIARPPITGPFHIS